MTRPCLAQMGPPSEKTSGATRAILDSLILIGWSSGPLTQVKTRGDSER